MNKVSPIIITGIHRSGTSLLTRIMENNAVFFGKTQDINNESIFFQNINKWIMSTNSSTWDNPKSFINTIDEESFDMLLDKIKILLNSRSNFRYFGNKYLFNKKSFFNLNYSWGWKDPRNIFTLPFWMTLFPLSKVIIVKRHPYDVSLSLINRNIKLKNKDSKSIHGNTPYFLIPFLNLSNFSNVGSLNLSNIEDAMALYHIYYSEIEKNLNKYKENIFFLKYEDIIINPKSTLIKIFDFCNLNYDNINLPEVINKDKLYTYKLKELKFDSEKYSKKLEKYGYNNES